MIPLQYLSRKIRKGRIIPYFITIDDPLLQKIRKLQEFYEKHLGKRYETFDEERIVEIIEDYKLAKSIQNSFYHWFSWESPSFEEILEKSIRMKLGVKNYQELRIKVFEEVPDGFTDDKNMLLETMQQKWNIDIVLDDVLWQDQEKNRVLVQHRKFDMKSFIAFYNREVLETMFYNASRLHLRTDDFEKNIFYLAKKHNLLFDANKNESIEVEVYGPVEMYGRPAKYGYRIVQYVLDLIGVLSSGKVTAQVHMKKKSHTFSITLEDMRALVVEEQRPIDEFDSFAEEAFFESFASNYSHWKIEREPEPIIQDNVIIVPDFALYRGGSYVYAEVIGFWTEEYIQKKIEKLNRVHDVSLILLVEKTYEKSTKKEFEKLGFPTVFYDFSKKPSSVPVIKILEEHFSDFEHRKIKEGTALEKIEEAMEGYITEKRLKDILNCYTQEELHEVLQGLDHNHIWIKGAGIFTEPSLEALRDIVKTCLKKPRSFLEEKLQRHGYPKDIADPVLKHMGYTVEWKNLNETEIVSAG